ncbi:MAG: PIG-L deacetylase family protein [Sphingorhabdus sp.]
MPTAIALSPHLDDAVFSAGGTLAFLAENGWEVRIVTAFTASVRDPQGFALACQLDKGLGPEIDYMAMRRKEDAAACAALGIRAPVWLDLPEAPHRGYHSAQALFAGVKADDDIDLRLARLLIPFVEDADLLFACQAIGGHVDHILAVRALMQIARPPTLWWTDFPYSIRGGPSLRPFQACFDVLESIDFALSKRARQAKIAACLCYASQLGFQFGGPAALKDILAQADTESLRIDSYALRKLQSVFPGDVRLGG